MFFVVQMDNVLDFAPNDETHPAFGEALAASSIGRGAGAGLQLPCHAGGGDYGSSGARSIIIKKEQHGYIPMLLFFSAKNYYSSSTPAFSQASTVPLSHWLA